MNEVLITSSLTLLKMSFSCCQAGISHPTHYSVFRTCSHAEGGVTELQHEHKQTCHVLCITVILQEGYPRSPLSQRGVPKLRLPPFATWIFPLKVPGAQRVRGAMKIPAEMAEQRSGVNLSPPVPLSCHFDVMAALRRVMWRSCQISGPVTALLPVCWA